MRIDRPRTLGSTSPRPGRLLLRGGLLFAQFVEPCLAAEAAVGRSLQQQPWAAWLVAGAMGLAAVELSRRRLQRRTRLALAGADDDTSLSWVPGLPGPFSTEKDIDHLAKALAEIVS